MFTFFPLVAFLPSGLPNAISWIIIPLAKVRVCSGFSLLFDSAIAVGDW